jgi:multiple sugar transport system permease protein
MNRRSRGRLIGMAYLAPALIFVLVFTVYPLGQMVWISLTNWSLLAPPKFVGLANYERAFGDRQFWVSFLFTLKYTAIITPVLIIGGYLLALLTSQNTPLRRFTRTVVFTPVVIGLGVSSLLWYWLFNTDFGLVNGSLLDLGLISEPLLWLGVEADRSNMAIIVSVVWKVIGFGMLLFVGAIQAVPTDVIEAAMVDGASYWQRVVGIIVPLTLRTILMVTLVSVIGSLLAFDQFYIMTAGQPHN